MKRCYKLFPESKCAKKLRNLKQFEIHKIKTLLNIKVDAKLYQICSSCAFRLNKIKKNDAVSQEVVNQEIQMSDDCSEIEPEGNDVHDLEFQHCKKKMIVDIINTYIQPLLGNEQITFSTKTTKKGIILNSYFCL